MSRLAMSQNLIEYYKFWMFLKQALSHIFLSWNSSCILPLYKCIQIRVSESGHATVKYFTEIVEFKMFLKTAFYYIFLSYSANSEVFLKFSVFMDLFGVAPARVSKKSLIGVIS